MKEIRLAASDAVGVYAMAAMMEHSCMPNIKMTFDKQFNVSLSHHILCFTVGRVLLGTRITFVCNSRIEKRITFMSNRLSWILIHSSEHLN